MQIGYVVSESGQQIARLRVVSENEDGYIVSSVVGNALNPLNQWTVPLGGLFLDRDEACREAKKRRGESVKNRSA